MRIALVAPLVSPIAQPYTGGTQALVAALAQGLQQRGHQVTLFARLPSVVPGVPIEQITVPKTVVPTNFSSSEVSSDKGFFAQATLFLDLFLHLQQRAAEFDLVHAHAFDWPAFVCSPLVKPLPIVHTLHLHALSPEINDALRVLHQRGHQVTLTTVSHTCAASYAPFTPIDAVIYNGLDLANIPFVSWRKETAPLLFAGRIAPEKGVEEAIEIAERAGCHLLLAGSIYDEEYYQQRIQPRLQRGAGRVTFLGALEQDELWRLMGSTRGLLFPIAWDEPFGLSPVEAMATGSPVIAFQRGAVAEIIRHGETGFLVPPGDIEQAVAYVPELAKLSSERCRAYVEQSFSLEHMLDEYEHVYEGLLTALAQ